MKKLLLTLWAIILAAIVICVFVLGGEAGAYAWSMAVFILAPAAAVALPVQIAVIAARCLKKKACGWNIAFIIATAIMALPITVLFGVSPVAYPTTADERLAVTMQLPVQDAVLCGGKEYTSHAMWPSECYAYDILQEPYAVGSADLADYGVYGQNILSPVSGTVIGRENNEPDIAPNTDEFLSLLGNYLFIKIEASGTYLILAHLKQGSITVDVGDQVNAGDLLGQVGNSGTTSEPHLHIQHQLDNPLLVKFPVCAVGLPINFINDALE